MSALQEAAATMLTLLLLSLNSGGKGLYVVELQLIQYENHDHVLKNGSCCDNPGMTNCTDHCDNYFIFWEGNTSTSPVYETEVYQVGDFIDFRSTSQIPLVGGSCVSNPLNFTVDSSEWQEEYRLHIEVRDFDGEGDPPDAVEDVHISIPLSLTPSFTKQKLARGQNENPNLNFYYAYNVSCAENYYYNGYNCSLYCKPRDDGLGHYTCSEEGIKLCRGGYTDPLTNCTKYSDVCSSLVPCKNNATCLNNGTSDTAYICYCPPGYGGIECSEMVKEPHGTDICSELNPCQNNGTCFESLPTGYECNCTDGYGGQNCTEVEDPQGADVCSEPNPCQNNGTCIESLPTSYQCNCTHGFEGQNCTEIQLYDDDVADQSSGSNSAVIGGIIGGLLLCILMITVVVIILLLWKQRKKVNGIKEAADYGFTPGDNHCYAGTFGMHALEAPPLNESDNAAPVETMQCHEYEAPDAAINQGLDEYCAETTYSTVLEEPGAGGGGLDISSPQGHAYAVLAGPTPEMDKYNMYGTNPYDVVEDSTTDTHEYEQLHH